MSEKVPEASISSASEPVVAKRNADATLDLADQLGDTVGPLTPEKQKRLKRTLYIRLLIPLIVINIWLFVCVMVEWLRACANNKQIDKATLSYSALLGILEETGLSNSQYNDLATIFYTGQ